MDSLTQTVIGYDRDKGSTRKPFESNTSYAVETRFVKDKEWSMVLRSSDYKDTDFTYLVNKSSGHFINKLN